VKKLVVYKILKSILVPLCYSGLVSLWYVACSLGYVANERKYGHEFHIPPPKSPMFSL